MQIICISKGAHSAGKALAQSLAEKLGHRCVCRDELIEAATQEGISVGKLEMAMVRGRGFSQQLALERDHYLAFSRAYLCERALKESVVYHGRTGHLLLQGVNNVLRIRAVQDLESRIAQVARELSLEREAASRYIQDVDADRERWVRNMYGVSVDEPINYDFTVNLQNVSVGNAASALVATAQLPDFQLTPASIEALKDLYLGARARMALARDEETYRAAVKVRADRGVVTVNYLPRDADAAPHIRRVLEGLPEVSDLRITMATATLLWIQEKYQAHSEVYDKVVEIATKWNAAVELVRLAPESAKPEQDPIQEPVQAAPLGGEQSYDGGIQDDEPDLEVDDGGVSDTLDELAGAGRAGGGKSVYGGQQDLVEALDRSFPYTLVVIGDAFLSKAHAARVRATRDLRSFLADRIRAPVVTADELGEQYLFGRKDLIRTVVFLTITVLLYLAVFSNQEWILAFMTNTGWYAEAVQGTFLSRNEWLPKIVVSLALVLFIPVVAYSYGRVTGAFMKLIKME